MKIIDYMEQHDYEQLVFCIDKGAGLRAIIAIHDTTLGPALGGARMWPYATEEEAIIDALRLGHAMTYKNSAAGLNLGGGKAVIIGDSTRDKSEALFRSLGRFIESLGGRYITTEDVGTTVSDMEHVRQETECVTGLPVFLGGSGDPSPSTGFGVYQGMKACAKEVFGSDSLKAKKVAIQGAGKVAYYLAGHLFQDGAEIVVTDIKAEAAKRVANEFGARLVEPDEIYDVECDIFSPCALGGVLNSKTIPRLKCRIVAGGANNQLLEDSHGDELKQRGILYAPDFIGNAGGVINLSFELTGYDAEAAKAKVAEICHTMERVIALAKSEGVSTAKAADRLAESRIEAVRGMKRMYSG